MTQDGLAASLAGVTHRYGKVIALDALTLGIPSGRMIGVIGPDGSAMRSAAGTGC